MSLGEFIGSGSTVTKGLYHLNGNANDSSGNGNNGVSTNITWVGGRNGSGAASFNGSSSKILLSSIPLTGNFTLSAFIKPIASTKGRIINQDTAQLTYGQYGFFMESTRKITLSVASSSGLPGASVTSNSVLTLGNFYLITGVRDGSYINIYINGVFDNRVTWTSSQYISSETCKIGYTANSGGTLFDVFNGIIDEVIVENRAWTAEEIRRYYTYSQGKFAIL